jgi:hypothetical protein
MLGDQERAISTGMKQRDQSVASFKSPELHAASFSHNEKTANLGASGKPFKFVDKHNTTHDSAHRP